MVKRRRIIGFIACGSAILVLILVTAYWCKKNHIERPDSGEARSDELKVQNQPDEVLRMVSNKVGTEDEVTGFAASKVGKEEGSINCGYVFIDGRYEELPYVLRNSDRLVLLNGKTVHTCRLNEKSRDDAQPTTDPGIPQWVTTTSTCDDIMRRNHGRRSIAFQKWDYLTERYSSRVAKEKFLLYLQSLPCVVRIEPEPAPDEDHPLFVKIMMKDGTGAKYVFAPKQRNLAVLDVGVSAEVNEQRALIESLLHKNCAVFFCNGGIAKSMGEKEVARRLPAAIAVVTSDLSSDNKMQIVVNLGIYSGREKFVRGFSASDELASRLVELEQKTGVTPITFDEAVNTPSLESLLGLPEN